MCVGGGGGGGGGIKRSDLCESGLLFFFVAFNVPLGEGGLGECYLLSNLVSKANHSQSV